MKTKETKAGCAGVYVRKKVANARECGCGEVIKFKLGAMCGVRIVLKKRNIIANATYV